MGARRRRLRAGRRDAPEAARSSDAQFSCAGLRPGLCQSGGSMKRTALALLTAFSAIVVSSAQQAPDHVRALPGDRPAPNTHATRSAVLGRHGMIATSQPMASAAGLKVLQEGGNAIDAAV